MKDDFLIQQFGERTICLKGVGKMFYQEGFPISLAVSELNKKGIEVSFLHMIEEFWNNGWSWKTIEMKLRGELEEDIDKSLQIDFDYLKTFYNCLEQPTRTNGGYEESREMIFQYLFGISTDDVRIGNGIEVCDWFRKVIIRN
jgi:hypothetical protein